MMDEQTYDAIMADIADGLPMRQAAENAKVSRRAAWYAIHDSDDRMHKYARAKESMVEAMADDMLQIADTTRRGVRTTTKDDGSTETIDGDMVERSRLQVDSRKWLLSKLAPKKYGDKLDMAVSGELTVRPVNYAEALEVSAAPLVIDHQITKRLSDAE